MGAAEQNINGVYHSCWLIFPALFHKLDWKQPCLLSVVGVLMVIGGECLRKLAMWTAGSNFNHYIRFLREDGHVLVTHGIFAVVRHPAYVGWFYWSIGTQVCQCHVQLFLNRERTKIMAYR